MREQIIRKILPQAGDFKSFWQKKGPFRYALTSREFPPMLLSPEEWLFGNDITELLKELLCWDDRKMKVVAAPFSLKKKGGFRPDNLAPWRITNFPEEWATARSLAFTPAGHLTGHVEARAGAVSSHAVTLAFFDVLKDDIQNLGYVLLEPEPALSPDFAHVDEYLKEWLEDEEY